MPTSREAHIHYTRDEFLGNKYDYYIKLTEFLKSSNDIESYLDLGANVGETWNIVKSLTPNIKQGYLIEAHPENYKFMLNNIKNGELCRCFNVAIDYSGKKYLSLLDDGFQNVGGYLLRDSTLGITVPCVTLESLNISPVDLFKIDVEGCEYDILKNSTYVKSCKYLEIEFHGPDKGLNFEEPKTFIESNFQNYVVLLESANYYRVLLKKVK